MPAYLDLGDPRDSSSHPTPRVMHAVQLPSFVDEEDLEPPQSCIRPVARAYASAVVDEVTVDLRRDPRWESEEAECTSSHRAAPTRSRNGAPRRARPKNE
jgi:hypothetical protein